MNTEYEVIVLDVDIKRMEKKLKDIGAKKKDEYFQRRYTYDFKPAESNRWIRLRDNGKKTELTIKEINSEEIVGGAKELDIEVSDFEKTNLILESLGYIHRNYQENKRIVYIYEDVEFCIDTWPKLDVFMEIEGKTEADVMNAIKLLNIDKKRLSNKHVTSLYKEKGMDITKIPELKF